MSFDLTFAIAFWKCVADPRPVMAKAALARTHVYTCVFEERWKNRKDQKHYMCTCYYDSEIGGRCVRVHRDTLTVPVKSPGRLTDLPGDSHIRLSCIDYHASFAWPSASVTLSQNGHAAA